MHIELSPKAAKYLKGMSQPDKGRMIRALEKLPQGNVVAMWSPCEGCMAFIACEWAIGALYFHILRGTSY